MSSNKKLRLDPESQVPNIYRTPSSQADVNRGFRDGSSFTSSTSGGNGSFGRSSAGPFRTRYSRPADHPLPNSSLSRFSPYYFGKERRSSLKVPLIRARRDDSDQDGFRPSSRTSLNSSIGGDSTSSATSSTAQRIIETLQNLSTPVLNAGKIRIDQDIKAVQPMMSFGIGNNYSRISPGSRSTGPPKMCSSLLLTNPSPANQTSPMGNADQRRLFCIPKMVDAATNTDKAKDESPSPQMHASIKPVPESRPSSTSNEKGAASGSADVASKSVAIAVQSSKDDNSNSDDEFHECSSEFAFSSAWPPETFDRYLSDETLGGNKTAMGEATEQQPLLNGYKETSSSVPTSKPAVTSSASSSPSTLGFAGSGKPATTLSVSSVPTSSSANSSTSLKSAGNTGFGFASASSKEPSFQGKEAAPGDKSKSDTAPNSSGSGGSFGISSSSPLNATAGSGKFSSSFFSSPVAQGVETTQSSEATKPAPKSEPLKVDMPIKQATTPTVDKVDAVKPNSTLPFGKPVPAEGVNQTKFTTAPLTVKSAGTKWRCPTCMVENDIDAQTCVCCSEKNPKAPSLVKQLPKKWRCPTCMVENELEALSCVCCSEKNPNPVEKSAVAKKWRCPTCMVQNDPNVPACVCCSEKNPTSSEKKDGPSTTTNTPAPAFKFGITGPISGSSSSNNSFTFGKSAESNTQSQPSSGFKFGAPAAPAPASTTSASVASISSNNANTGFSFGVSTATTAVTQPANSFSFSTLASTPSQPATTTASVTTTTPSVFGVPTPSAETSGTSIMTGGTVFGSGGFQSATQSGTGGNFGGFAVTPTTVNDPQKTTSTFGGFSANSKPFSSTFSFGSSQQSPLGTAQVIAPTPTPSVPANFSFGTSNPPSASPFGNIAPSQSAQAPPPFQFTGAAATSPPAPTPTPGPPSFNFGSVATPGSSMPFGNPLPPTPTAGSQPPTLFQFQATPSTNESPGARQIKRAVRRFKK